VVVIVVMVLIAFLPPRFLDASIPPRISPAKVPFCLGLANLITFIIPIVIVIDILLGHRDIGRL